MDDLDKRVKQLDVAEVFKMLKTSHPQGVTTKLESRLDQGNGIETSLKKGTFLRLECHQLGRQ
ncbi:hypothetical protein, partial [Leptolyngbya sp. FACHB-161]|uniref:hypothetical protein n=2 Tax=Leptolyngbya TaxID=47251 RepID=UPI001A7E4170